jgi:hypothetical protein
MDGIFGSDWAVAPEEQKRIRLRYWLGYAACVVLYFAVFALLEFFFGPLFRHFSVQRTLVFMLPGLIISGSNSIAPSLRQENARRRFRLEITDEAYIGSRGHSPKLVLDRAEVTEAQRTLDGGLWLVTRLRRRRIAVPRGMPEIDALRALLRERGVREAPVSRWVVWYLLPTACLYAGVLLSLGAITTAASHDVIATGWAVLLVLLGWQIFHARQDNAYEADGLVAILAVAAVIVTVIAAFRIFAR